MDSNRFPPHLLGLAAIIALLLTWTVFILSGYNQGILQNESTQIYLQAGGVIANTILIAIYLLLILRERQEAEEKRLRWLFADVISQVIDPSRERTMENRGKIESGKFDWTVADPVSELSTLSRDLGTESAHIERFEERFPDLYDDLEYHDNELRIELVRTGEEIRDESKGPLEDYFEENPIGFSDTDSELADRMLRIYLNEGEYWKPGGPFQNTEYKRYMEHSSNITKIVEQESEIEFEEYIQMRIEYIEFCTSLYERLGRAKDKIRQDYPISSDHLNKYTR